MRKIISALTAFITLITGSVYNKNIAYSSDEQVKEQIKIMAIGDSITDGYGVAGSYRKYLYNELSKKGYNIDMVGAKGNNMLVEFNDPETGESFMYDDDNTGYSGYAIKEYPGRNGILETLKSTNCLETCNPDIVILQIGTNNIIDNHDRDMSYNDAKELIDYILDNISDDSTLFVTTIPDVDPNRPEVYSWFSNYRHSADWQINYSDEEAEESIARALNIYNADILAYVGHLMINAALRNLDEETGDLTSSDQSKEPYVRPGYISNVITDVKSQLMDGVHPNNKGYKLMGEYWADTIDSYLNNTDTDSETYQVADLVKLQRYILGKYYNVTDHFVSRYDVNKDDSVDVFDVIALRKKLITDSSK